MPSDIDMLMEMGFEKARIEKALAQTGHTGYEVALEWLISHADDPTTEDKQNKTVGEVSAYPGDASVDPSDVSVDHSDGSQQQAKSLKCDDCNKLLRSTAEVEFHAAKTGHSNFSESVDEIKPLTEEEKQAQLAKVQELLKQKRLEKEEKEKQEQLNREKARRVQGREMLQTKQKLEEDEMKKMIDQRKRDKEEERLARQRVRDQIEKDRLDRETKFGSVDHSATSPSQQQQKQVNSPTAASAASATPSTPVAPKVYTETKLQVRLLNGDKVAQTFQVRETLAAVRLFIQLNHPECQMPFTFATTFPRKVYDESDMQAPLGELGLVPSAVLVVTKGH